MARLKAPKGSNPGLLGYFRDRCVAQIDRFEDMVPSELATRDLLFPRHAIARRDAIDAGESFHVGRWELPLGTEVSRLTHNYVVHPDGQLEPIGENI